MNKDAFINVCNTFKNDIDDMYMFNCLQLSGFSNDQAYNLKSLLKDLWLKDENCRCISGLSDMLYEYYTNHAGDIDMSTRQLLVKMYEECDI